MSLFETYESDFQLAYGEIQHTLDELPSLSGPERRAAAAAASRAVDEADEIVAQLAIEVQNIATGSRTQYNARIRQFRDQVEQTRKRLKTVVEQGDRAALFGSAASPKHSDDIALDQRQQLLSGTASLDRSTDRLRDSQRVAAETEAVGASILGDLRGQREQIINSRNTLLEADGFVDTSLRTLRGMSRRLVANRVITYAIIAVLIVLILLVIASKFW